MKQKLLLWLNRCLTVIVAALGFQCCTECMNKYGVPYTELKVQGRVTDTQEKPLDNMQVVVDRYWYNDTVYTNGKGEYASYGKYVGQDSVTVVVNDTAGVYASDSTKAMVEYVSQKSHYEATAGMELKNK